MIGIAIAAVVVTRAIAIYGFGSLCNLFVKTQIGWREQTVLWWGGLRGSVSIALALSVPATLPGREVIIDIVFGVVLFTLLVQGLTTKFFLEKLDSIGDQPLRQKYSEVVARRIALSRVMKYLSQAEDFRKVDPEFCRYQAELVEGQLKSLEEEIYQMQVKYPQLRELEIEQMRDKLLDIEADTYAELIRSGWLNNQLSPLLQEVLSREE